MTTLYMITYEQTKVIVRRMNTTRLGLAALTIRLHYINGQNTLDTVKSKPQHFQNKLQKDVLLSNINVNKTHY